MIIKDNSFSIVVIGNWNPHILSPQWISKSLFEDKPEVQVQFSLNLDASNRFIVKNIIFVPSNDRLIIQSSDNSDDSLLLIQETVIKLCKILCHTPIRALGINLGFIHTESNEKLLELINFNDVNDISENDWNIKSSSVKRNIEKNGYNLNLTIEYNSQSEFHFDFNYHYALSEPSKIEEVLNMQIVKFKEVSLSVLNNFYGLTLD